MLNIFKQCYCIQCISNKYYHHHETRQVYNDLLPSSTEDISPFPVLGPSFYGIDGLYSLYETLFFSFKHEPRHTRRPRDHRFGLWRCHQDDESGIKELKLQFAEGSRLRHFLLTGIWRLVLLKASIWLAFIRQDLGLLTSPDVPTKNPNHQPTLPSPGSPISDGSAEII